MLKWFLYVQLASLGSCLYVLHRTECDCTVVMPYCAPPLSMYFLCMGDIFQYCWMSWEYLYLQLWGFFWVGHQNRLSFIMANSKAALELDVFKPTLTHWSHLDSIAAGYKVYSYVWFQKTLKRFLFAASCPEYFECIAQLVLMDLQDWSCAGCNRCITSLQCKS